MHDHHTTSSLPTLHKIQGAGDGPTTVIMGGVHGNEPSGVSTILHLIKNLSIDTGTVILVIANPRAIQQDTRKIDADLNRSFLETRTHLPTYERACVEAMLPFLDTADYLLDLHNTVTNPSPRFLIVEDGKTYGPMFDVDYVVTGISTSHPGSTDAYMESKGKIGICLECGWIQDNPKANAEFALNQSLNFLRHIGHIKQPPQKSNTDTQKILDFSYIYVAQEKFQSSKKFVDFEKISAGDLIGVDGKQKIYAQKDCFILFCSQEATHGKEGFLLSAVPVIS